MSPKGRKDAEEGIQTEGRKLLRDWFEGKLDDGGKRPRSKLAELLGVSEPAIGYWLKGTSRPELHYRAAIEAICGIPATAWELSEERAKLADALERLAAEERKAEGDAEGEKETQS